MTIEMEPPPLTPSQLITGRIDSLQDWRGAKLKHLRTLILAAHPDIIEEWKWMGTPVWSCHGIICTGETYKSVVKLTFAKGAALGDPTRLFNASLEGNTRRAIDVDEASDINAAAFQALIRTAVDHNRQTQKPARKNQR